MSGDFTGRTVVVTGGASGIGAAVADCFLARGAKVWSGDLSAGRDERVIWRCCDVGREGDVSALLEDVLATEGRLDVLVNNAGIQPLGVDLSLTTPELLGKTMEVNLAGVIWGIKHAGILMKPGGSIVSLGSFVGSVGIPGGMAYAVSKAGVAHATKCAALELASRGIRVNAVAPGTIRTPAVEGIADNPEIPFVEGRTPLGRLGEPAEVAEVVVFLASERASYVTGAVVPVDGGIAAGWERYDLEVPEEFRPGGLEA